MCKIFIAEKKCINSEEASVVVLFELPAHDWSELLQSPQWKAVENLLNQLNEKGRNMKNEELITALDEETENCIRKLRNARYGYEIRTFITEYEELMLKKSDVLKRELLKEEQEKKMPFTEQVWTEMAKFWTEINKVEKKLAETEHRTDVSFESAEYAERQARQAKILSILALAVSAITAIINIFIFCMR